MDSVSKVNANQGENGDTYLPDPTYALGLGSTTFMLSFHILQKSLLKWVKQLRPDQYLKFQSFKQILIDLHYITVKQFNIINLVV